MTDKQVVFNAKKTLEVIGCLFQGSRMMPPKTKKGKSKQDIEQHTMLFLAHVLTGNDGITEQDLIDIAYNGRDFMDYMEARQ